MHQNRFFIPCVPPTVSEIWIEGKEAHHIVHVKRVLPGSTITLFDGKGAEYSAKVIEISGRKLKVSVGLPQLTDREAHINITIAFSIPKGKKADFLIQKCSELGIKTLIPLHCERSVVDIRNKYAEKLSRWNKIAVEASKQCKRNMITGIEGVMTLDDMAKIVYNYDLALIASAENEVKTLKRVLSAYPAIKKILCLVGPEGGFTLVELGKAINAGCIPITMGNSILRVETAVIALSSMILYAYSRDS
ncbi:MAG: 16S rRNA (uracil(1498)-N(3))-methyltransferase [Candidatus Brocadiaceae bacterium]|nr:16S rRNA (uracil(1498)-N(3))-methyltransferase [Candidatus Brocadiaceae bacterium]